MNRPNTSEFAPYYARYIDLVPDEPVVSFLKNQMDATLEFLRKIPAEKWTYAYAPEKWTLAESWIHVIDTERIFAYRALRVARGDSTPLPGFDQNDYVPNANAQNRTAASIITEFATVRAATLSLLENCNEKMWLERGRASNNPVSTRSLAYMIAGHVQHHINITNKRYLS